VALGFEVRIPPAARGAFVALAPGLMATWALAGLYLSLGPSLAASLLNTRSFVVGALVPTTLCGATAVASVLTRTWSARRAVVGGSVLLALGVGITIVGIRSQASFPLFLGSGVAGLGFGPAFAGSFRTLAPLAKPQEGSNSWKSARKPAHFASTTRQLMPALLPLRICSTVPASRTETPCRVRTYVI